MILFPIFISNFVKGMIQTDHDYTGVYNTISNCDPYMTKKDEMKTETENYHSISYPDIQGRN